MGRTRVAISISLPPEMAKEYERLAKETKKSKSELFREMIHIYEDYLDEVRWQRIQRLGEITAEKFNIESEEDLDKILHKETNTK